MDANDPLTAGGPPAGPIYPAAPADASEEILAPDQPVVLSTGEHVTVKELSWKATKRFLTTLASRSAEFFSLDRSTGTVAVDNAKLVQVLTTDLGENLILAATGRESAWLDELPARDFVLLLERAAAVNLRPDMIQAAKNIGGRFGALTSKATSGRPTSR